MAALNGITITKIYDAANIRKTETQRFVMENRPSFGLSFCKSGHICYNHNGKSYISSPDCAIIIPKGASYELVCQKDGIFPLINFECEGFNETDFKSIPLRNAESYIKDTEKLHDMLYFPDRHLKAMCLFYDIIERLSIESRPQSSPIQPAIEYIENNLCNSSLDNLLLAEICGLSESHFRKLFRESRGTSPKQYILDIRIKKSKALLRETHKSITKISEECGFASVYHFCRAFKSICGCTPTEYRSLRFINGI